MKINEDVYTKAPGLGDYLNAFMHIRMVLGFKLNNETNDDVLRLVKEQPIQKIEEWFTRYSDNKREINILENYPLKTGRINQVAMLANTTENIILLKQYLNELCRLIYDKETTLPFLEKEADPDLLNIES